MNRYLYVALLGGLLLLGVAVWILWPDSPPSTNGQQTPSFGTGTDNPYIPYGQSASDQPLSTDEQGAQAAYQTALATDNLDNIKPGRVVVADGYALQTWTGDNTGGEALLKFDSAQSAWVIVDPGGGRWSLEGLMSFGVPEDVANKLLQVRTQ